MTDNEIKQAIEACREKLGITIPIFMEWNDRFTTKMGDACYYKYYGRIRLSVKLFRRASEQDQRETVIHEVCHIAKEHLGYPGDHHGYWWKTLNYKCGIYPKRTHNVDTTGLSRKQDRYSVKCGCQNPPTITKNLLTRMRRGAAYKCKACGQRISL